MPEGLGGLVYKTAEEGLEHTNLGQGLSTTLHDFVDHTFTLNSKLTGKGGEVIGKMLKSFEDRKDYHLTQFTPKTSALPGTTPEPHEIMAQAVKKARAEVFGQKHENLARALAVVRQEHGAHGDYKVKELTDHLGIYFHDLMYQNPKSKGWNSTLSSDLSKSKALAGIKFAPSTYSAPGQGSSTVMNRAEVPLEKIASGAFAYKAGLAHAPQSLVNGLQNARASSLIKAIGEIFGSGYKGAKSQLIASNAVGSMLFHEYSQMYNFKSGAIAKLAPGSVGEFVHKNWLIPGMDAARNMGMVISGLTGKYDAQYAAHAVMNGQEKRASLILERMGIKWQDVKARGGQLTQYEQEQAMRSMIQQNMFRDRNRYQTKLGASTPIGRLFTIFHSYAVMEGNLITESIKRNMFQMHDPAMLLQQLATLAVVIPTVGNAIYSIDEAWTGRNEHPVDNFVGREKAIYEGHQAAEIFKAISHMGGFGVAAGMINGASRHRLANYFLGAPINAGIEAVESGIAATKSDSQHPHAADEFKRDLLHDVPSMGIGAYIASKAYPTKTARDATRPMTSRRLSARRAAARRKLRHTE